MLLYVIKKLASRFGYRLIPERDYPHKVDLPANFLKMASQVLPFTQTSEERLFGVYSAIQHIEDNKIPGAIVECGVWRGGSAMMAALALKSRGNLRREIFLYDTFAGMPEPESVDVDYLGKAAHESWEANDAAGFNHWNFASIEEVQRNLQTTGFPKERLRLVKGMVEDTIPKMLPEQISLLRLDTDFYKSTLHELEHLYPLLSPGGVLIIDDYGHFKGAQQAVDEYFKAKGLQPYLHRLDYTGRLVLKNL